MIESQHTHSPSCLPLRALAEVLRPFEHFSYEDAGRTQQIQFTELQAMSWEAEGSTDLLGAWDALWG